MEKNIHTLIIPDVHGRVFWKKPVEETLENTDAKIVFLGDYLDPYLFEFEVPDPDVEYSPNAWERQKELAHSVQDGAITIFKDIIELKKKYPNRITLLIGNHDCGYAVSRDICDCRTDRWNFEQIRKIFGDNDNLFQLAAEDTINGRHFIFSHAGIHKEYAERCFGEEINENNVVDYFNNAWLTKNYGIMDSLAWCSFYRGGWSKYGSIVWADVHEWAKGNDDDKQEYMAMQIFGHSQQEKDPVIGENVACLDCRKAFYIDNDGKIKEYDEN